MDYIKLQEVCDVRDGTHDSPSYIQTGGYPLVTSKNIIDGKIDLSDVNYIAEEDYTAINKRSNVDTGDIIMPMIGTIGNPVIVGDFCDFAIKNVSLIKPKSPNIIIEFVYYLLKSDAFVRFVKSKNRGGTQKFISLNDIRNIDVPIIPLSEQIKSVTLLKKAEHLIKLHRHELQALDELIKARFVELFGHVSTMNSSPIKMSKVLTVNPKKDDIDDDIDVTFLPMEKVGTNGSIDTTEIRKYKDVKKGFNHIKENDVLFAKITPCMENGKATIARGLCNGYGNSTTELFALRCNEDVVPEYIFQIVHSEYFRKCAEENMTGTAGQRRVPKSFIAGFNIVVPPVELQNEFAEFVKQVDKSKVVVQKALDEAQTLFDSLMQQYFG